MLPSGSVADKLAVRLVPSTPEPVTVKTDATAASSCGLMVKARVANEVVFPSVTL